MAFQKLLTSSILIFLVISVKAQIHFDDLFFSYSDDYATIDIQYISCDEVDATVTLDNSVSWSYPVDVYLQDENYQLIEEFELNSNSVVISNIQLGNYVLSLWESKFCKYDVDLSIYDIADCCEIMGDAEITEQCQNGPGSITGGSILLQPNQGTPPYSYTWSNGSTTQQISNLGEGNYDVTVTDNAGCVLEASYEIESLEEFSVTTEVTSALQTALGEIDGSVLFTISNPSSPYTVNFNQ